MGTMRVLGAAVLLAVVGGAAGCQGSAPAPDPASSEGGAALARELFDLTNGEREAAGLPALEWSGCLATKAEERAAPFVEDAGLVHDVLVATCVPGAAAGENLSRSDRGAGEVVEAWMGSAGHRANLLAADFSSSAVACLPASEGVYACAQLFEGDAAE